MKKEDFRIKEYDKVFIIEKIEYVPFLSRPIHLLNQKYKWILYDDNLKWQDRIICPSIKGGYTSLESAKNRLEKILEEPKYHYL